MNILQVEKTRGDNDMIQYSILDYKNLNHVRRQGKNDKCETPPCLRKLHRNNTEHKRYTNGTQTVHKEGSTVGTDNEMGLTHIHTKNLNIFPALEPPGSKASRLKPLVGGG